MERIALLPHDGMFHAFATSSAATIVGQSDVAHDDVHELHVHLHEADQLGVELHVHRELLHDIGLPLPVKTTLNANRSSST